jgi:hypothetical protein
MEIYFHLDSYSLFRLNSMYEKVYCTHQSIVTIYDLGF